MNKQAVLAALKKLGVTLGDAADDAALRASIITILQSKGIAVDPSADSAALVAELEKLVATSAPQDQKSTTNQASAAELSQAMARIRQLEAQNSAHLENVATQAVDAAIEARKITVKSRDKWIARAKADIVGITAELADMPSVQPADTEPAVSGVVITDADPKNVVAEFTRIRSAFQSFRRGNDVTSAQLSASGKRMFGTYLANRDKLRAILAVSTNTIDAGLQRTVILGEALLAFKKVLAPVRVFSTTFSDVVLEGAGTVDVPYYPLMTTASQDFVAATGYNTPANTTANTRTVTLDKRKYQSFDFGSATLRRQPRFDPSMHLMRAAEQLAVDVVADILSAVTVANFATAAHTGTADAFDFSDLVDIRTSCTDADWPITGRSVVLDSAWSGALLKDSRVSDADKRGSDADKREGSVGRICGFDVYECIRIPANSEQLSGFACFPSALLAATAPIEPAPGVRNLLADYEVMQDPDTGIGFSYRHGGNTTLDRDERVIEAAYGYAKGEGAALQRIVDSTL